MAPIRRPQRRPLPDRVQEIFVERPAKVCAFLELAGFSLYLFPVVFVPEDVSPRICLCGRSDGLDVSHGDFSAGIVWSVMAGATANYLYFWHCREHIGEIKKAGRDGCCGKKPL